ncbi:PilW family protein [Polaromonas sp.]|uniref:PilW family protein n=1 Tax=Polaromonas sp. TaxID=1869339 RepID=UPI003266CA4A
MNVSTAFKIEVTKSHQASQGGFTLIELMISLALGLLTVLVITNVMIMSEGQRRSATSGSDAQVNGALSLYMIQRDVQMAGYGLASNPAALGCGINASYGGTALTGFPLVVAPVVIEDNGNAGSKVSVLISRKSSFSVPMPVTEDHPVGSGYFVVRSAFGTTAGDMFVAVPSVVGGGFACALLQATNSGGALPTTLSTVVIPHETTSQWNPANLANTFPAGSYLINLGPMAYRSYAVSAGLSLQTTNLISATGTAATEDLYPEIVKFQAMYGKDTNADGVVDTYDTTTPTTAAGWQQVLAVRVAVVARSGQYEREVVTSAAPLWNLGTGYTVAGTSACFTGSQCLSLGLSHITDWDHYRYKVYDTVIPLRNVLWNS